MDHQLSTKFYSVLGSRKHVCVSVTDLSKWRTFRPTLDREAATTDSGKPCKKKIRLATKYAFWCTNTTMWNSRSKLISTPFPHLRENSSKFRLSGPITAVTHNKSFSDCFSVKIYLHHHFTTDPTRSKYNHIEIIRKAILRHFGYYQWHISKGSWLVIFLLSNQIEV